MSELPRPTAPLGLAEAKLVPPRLRDGLITREALLRPLLATHDQRVVLIVAPAGYGKTTLLTQWRARERRPVAWVTVGPLDVDPMGLLAYVAVAIDRAVGLDPSIVDMLRSDGISALSTAVPRITSALHEKDPELLLLIDDVHVLEGSPSIDALDMLIEYLPPKTEVALAGRGNPGLPRARLRASGRLLELNAQDLALNREEWDRAVAHRDEAAPVDASRLRDSTEGWPVAAFLVGRAIHGGIDAGAALSTTGRFRRDIGAYIDSEVLAALAPEDRSFLMRTSILERLTGGLCDAVLDVTGSGVVLERLSAATAMVIPLDAEGGWYRYHPLLRERLRERLEREGLDADALERRAAGWLVANGLAHKAVNHLFAAGDLDAAAELISSLAMSVYRAGRTSTLMNWVEGIGHAEVRRYPYLGAFATWIHLLRGEAPEAFRMADLIEDAGSSGERTHGANSHQAVLATARALMARAGLAAAIRDAEFASAIEPLVGAWQPNGAVVLGCIRAIAGEPDLAERSLQEAEDMLPSDGAERARATALSWRAMLAFEDDRWLEATKLADQAVLASDRFRHEPDIVAAAVAAVAARAAIHRNAPQEARRHLSTFQATRPALSVATPWFSVRVLYEAALGYLALADAAGARAVLRSADPIVRLRPDLGTLPRQLAALRAQTHRLPPGLGGASTMTVAELRVLRYLPTYLTVPQMAERLSVAPSTVRTQVQSIYGKLGAASRAEAVELAIRSGLLEPLPALGIHPAPD